jgi:hypothetical protein
MRVALGIIDGAWMLVCIKIDRAAPQTETRLKLSKTNVFFIERARITDQKAMITTRGAVEDGAAGVAATTIGIEPLSLKKLRKVSEGGLGNREHVESRFADVFLDRIFRGISSKINR